MNKFIKTKETIINDLKKMWQQNFLDAYPFIDLFFDYFYSKENVFYTEKNDKIISCLYLLPFYMQFFKTEVKTAYLCGAITCKEHRGKGEMTKLVKSAFNYLFNNDTWFCVLIPSNEKLFEHYKKFGYFESYYNNKILLKKERLPSKKNISFKESKDAKFFSKIYNEVYYQNELSISRDERLFDFLIRDYSIMEDTKVLKIYNNLTPCGYLFHKIENGKGIIMEFCYKDISFFEFKNAVLSFFNVNELLAIAPSFFTEEKGEKYKMGMIRIINLYNALSQYAKKNPHIERVFTVKDELIKQNNVSYKISNGIVSKTNEINDKILDINDISSIIFNREGYINMLLI